MCLYLNPKNTAELAATLKEQGKRLFYKEYELSRIEKKVWWEWIPILRSLRIKKPSEFKFKRKIVTSMMGEKLKKAGWIKSDRESLTDETDYKSADIVIVRKGIHVYRNAIGRNDLSEATLWGGRTRKDYLYDPPIILPVWGYAEDFVAAGCHRDAVFVKIKIDPICVEKAKQLCKAVLARDVDFLNKWCDYLISLPDVPDPDIVYKALENIK